MKCPIQVVEAEVEQRPVPGPLRLAVVDAAGQTVLVVGVETSRRDVEVPAEHRRPFGIEGTGQIVAQRVEPGELPGVVQVVDVLPFGQYTVVKSSPAVRTRSSRARRTSSPGRPDCTSSIRWRERTATPFQAF